MPMEAPRRHEIYPREGGNQDEHSFSRTRESGLIDMDSRLRDCVIILIYHCDSRSPERSIGESKGAWQHDEVVFDILFINLCKYKGALWNAPL